MTWVPFIGVAISTVRKAKGLTQDELGALLQPPVPRGQISTLENGHTGASMERLAAIAAALEVPAHELVRTAERWAELDASAGEA